MTYRSSCLIILLVNPPVFERKITHMVLLRGFSAHCRPLPALPSALCRGVVQEVAIFISKKWKKSGDSTRKNMAQVSSWASPTWWYLGQPYHFWINILQLGWTGELTCALTLKSNIILPVICIIMFQWYSHGWLWSWYVLIILPTFRIYI